MLLLIRNAGRRALLHALLLLLLALTARGALAAETTPVVPAGWEWSTGEGVRVVHPRGAGSLARQVAQRAPGLLRKVDRALGVRTASPEVTIYLASDMASLAAVHRSGAAPAASGWAAGYALRGRPVVVLTPHAHRGPLVYGFWSVLHHELVHVRMGSLLGDRGAEVPQWYWEGTASVLAREGARRDIVTLAHTAIRSGAPDLEDLERRFPADEREASAAYVASYAFVNWLAHREGESSIAKLLDEVSGGAAFGAAFESTYGERPEVLQQRWRRGFLWRYRWIPLLTSGTTMWLGVTGLFLFAWWRKRRRSRLILGQWEDEERRAREGTWIH